MVDQDLQCTYCGFQYQGRASSLLMLHKCSDEEFHYIDRIDLEEEPLEETDAPESFDIHIDLKDLYHDKKHK